MTASKKVAKVSQEVLNIVAGLTVGELRRVIAYLHGVEDNNSLVRGRQRLTLLGYLRNCEPTEVVEALVDCDLKIPKVEGEAAKLELASKDGKTLIPAQPVVMQPEPDVLARINERGYHVKVNFYVDAMTYSFYSYFTSLANGPFKTAKMTYSADRITPVRFVKSGGDNLYVPVTSVEDVRLGITKLKRSGVTTRFEPWVATTKTVKPKVGHAYETDPNYQPDPRIFEDVVNPDVLKQFQLDFDIDGGVFLGFKAEYTTLEEDANLGGNPMFPSKVKQKKYSTKSSGEKADQEKLSTRDTLVVDSQKRLLVSRNLTANRSELHTYLHDMMAIASNGKRKVNPRTIIINNAVFPGKTLEDKLEKARHFNCELDKEGTICGLITPENSKSGAIIISSGTLRSVEHYLAIQQEVSLESYAKKYIERYTKAHKDAEKNLAIKLAALQQQQLSVANQLGDTRFVLELIETNGELAFQKKLANFADIPGVEKCTFGKEGIIITTEEFSYDAKYHKSYGDYGSRFLGKYKITLDLIGNKVSLQNLMQAKAGGFCVTTHNGGSSNGICLGSYQGILTSCMSNADHELLVMTLLEFLRDAHLGDGLGRTNFRNNFPKTKPEKTVVGRDIILFYGSASSRHDEIEEEECGDCGEYISECDC